MTVNHDDFRVAAALCTLEFEKLYHLMMLVGFDKEAAQVRSVDKGKLVAGVVTRGIDGEGFSHAERFMIVLACLQGAHRDGLSLDEVRGMLREMRGEHAARKILQRMREGSKP